MHPAAIISGIGLVTPLGGDVESNWQALLAGRSIRDHARVPDLDAGESRIYQIARRAALIAAGSKPGLRADALVVGTSKGEADEWIASGSIAPAGIGNLVAHLGSELGILGPRLTVSAACASGLQALIRGTLLIAAGDAERVLVVAAESSLHPMFLENYRRLGVLAAEGHGCRPFDRDRQGFCLSEAAASVLLERTSFTAEEIAGRGAGAETTEFSPWPSVPSVLKNSTHHPPAGATQKIAIESFAFGADATHLTGSDPTGKPLRNLLARVVADRQFDLIHAHGTGTIANDPVELHALQSVLPDWPDSLPVVFSHKGALGHSLGAAGLISIVLNVQMHRNGIIPANINTSHPLPAERVTLGKPAVRRSIRRSLAVAAGFGGAMAAVSLRAME